MNYVDDELCDNPLHEAVRLRDMVDTKNALNEGCHPDTIGLFQWNALHEAASNGDNDIVNLLLNYKADPNKPDLLNHNTALHYACTENHAQCVVTLLNAGADMYNLNNDKNSPFDLIQDDSCKRIFFEHGYVSKYEKKIKSILKLNKDAASKSSVSKSPVRAKPSRVVIDTSSSCNDTDSIPSPNSVDSGRFSSLKSPSKRTWELRNDDFLQLPSSPARSVASSYGSMTSLGSSGCSVADDCAGQFVLSFRYNSKSEELKIVLFEIRLVSLIASSKLTKGTSIHLCMKSIIRSEGEQQPHPTMKRKSEGFRLYSMNHASEGQSTCTSSWGEREAKLEFKSPIKFEYSGITKNMINSSSIQLSLCIQRKRTLLTFKSLNPSDPILASLDIPLKEAEKRIRKESYDTVRHDVLGVTRQAIPLEGVISDSSSSYENRSFASDPPSHITSLAISTDEMTRSSSVGNLKSLRIDQLRSSSKKNSRTHRVMKSINQSHGASSVDLTSEEGRDSDLDKSGTYSISSLDSVISHSFMANAEVSLRVPLKTSDQLGSVEVDRMQDKNDSSEIRVAIPYSTSSSYQDFKQKQAGDKRGRVAQKAKFKLKSALRPNVTMVTALDDEEKSMGSPSEELPLETRLTRLGTHSSSSFIEVDESPHRPSRRPNNFPPSPKPSPQRPSSSASSPLKSNQWVGDIDPRDTIVSIGTDRKPAVKTKNVAAVRSRDLSGDLTRVEKMQGTATNRSRRNSVLRRLVYDEIHEELSATDNPGYIHS